MAFIPYFYWGIPVCKLPEADVLAASGGDFYRSGIRMLVQRPLF